MSKGTKLRAAWRPPHPAVLASMDVDALCAVLARAGVHEFPTLDAAILARGRDIVAPLAAWARALAPLEGYAPAIAARRALLLLAELEDPMAAAAVVELLVEFVGEDPETIVADGANLAAERLGALVLEPALEALAQPQPISVVETLVGVLAAAGPGDPRVRRHVADELIRDPYWGATAALRFGDPTLLPDLRVALEDVLRGVTGEPSWHQALEIFELIEAIEGLGGAPTASQRAWREVALRVRRTV